MAIAADDSVLQSWSRRDLRTKGSQLSQRVWEVTDRFDRPYALKMTKLFGQTQPASRFISEARILSHLGHCGVPVAAPVPTDDGNIFAQADDGALYTLTPMLPVDDDSQTDPFDPTLLRNIGTAIAGMHVALASCPYEIDSWQVEPANFQENWQTLGDEMLPEVFDDLAATLRPWWDMIMDALGDNHRQRVHGDVHGGNILTLNTTVTGIIDIDHLPLAPRSYDIGYYLVHGVQWPLKQDAPRPPDEEEATFITRQLLAGYEKANRLTPPEVHGLPAIALAVTISFLAYFIKQENRVEESWIHTANWIAAHPQALRGHGDLAGETR